MKDLGTFQLVVIAVCVMLALLGLLLFANFSGTLGGDTKAGEVTIWGTLPKEAVEAGIQELTAVSEDFGDVVYVERSESTWRRDLADALAEGRGPDLIIISQEELLTEKGKLAVVPFSTLSERTYVDSFAPLFELFLTVDGSYGVPLAVDPLVLYYNRSILSSENIATAPRTWEAVAGLAPVLSKRTDASAVLRSTIAFGEYENVVNARGILSLLLLQAGTPITSFTGQETRSVLSEQPSSGSFGATPAESAVSYYAQFSDPAKTVYSWNRSLPSSREAFLSGDLALYFGYASELTYLLEANPNLDFDMTQVPQPGTASARMTYGKAYVLALPKGSDNAAGALSTMLALSEDKPMAAIARGVGMAPSRRALLLAPDNDRYAAVYFPEALVAEGWLSPSPTETDSIFSSMMGNISSGRMEVDEALRTAGSAIDAALRE